MLFLCLDPAFLNHFIVLSSGAILLSLQIFSVMGCGTGWQKETASENRQGSLLACFGWDHFCTSGADRTTTIFFLLFVFLPKHYFFPIIWKKPDSLGTFVHFCFWTNLHEPSLIPSFNITLRLSDFSELSLYGTDCSILSSMWNILHFCDTN